MVSDDSSIIDYASAANDSSNSLTDNAESVNRVMKQKSGTWQSSLTVRTYLCSVSVSRQRSTKGTNRHYSHLNRNFTLK